MGTSKKKERRKARMAEMDLAVRMARERSLPESMPVRLLKGEAKMSEILIGFAEPLLELVDNEKAALTLAMAAWNIAIFPEQERDEAIDEITDAGFQGNDPQLLEGIRAVLHMLVLRKLTLHPDNKRLLLGFESTESGDTRTLNVISTVCR